MPVLAIANTAPSSTKITARKPSTPATAIHTPPRTPSVSLWTISARASRISFSMRSDRSANRSVAARTRPESRGDSWAMELPRDYRRRFGVRRDAVALLAKPVGLCVRGGLEHAEEKEADGRRRAEQQRRLAPREIGGGFQQLLDGLVANLAGEVVDALGRLAREAGKLRRRRVEFARRDAHRGRHLAEQVRPAGNALLYRVLRPLRRRGRERARGFLRLAHRLLGDVGNFRHRVRRAAAYRFGGARRGRGARSCAG